MASMTGARLERKAIACLTEVGCIPLRDREPAPDAITRLTRAETIIEESA